MDIKEHLRRMVDAIRSRDASTLDDIASALGMSHGLLVNSLNPNVRALPRVGVIMAMAQLARYSPEEVDDLKVAIAMNRLTRKDGEIHDRMLDAVPKTRRRELLLALADVFIGDG